MKEDAATLPQRALPPDFRIAGALERMDMRMSNIVAALERVADLIGEVSDGLTGLESLLEEMTYESEELGGAGIRYLRVRHEG